MADVVYKPLIPLPEDIKTPFTPLKVTFPKYDKIEYYSLTGSTAASGNIFYTVPNNKTFVLETVYITCCTLLNAAFGRMFIYSSADVNNAFVEIYVKSLAAGDMDGRTLSIPYPRGLRFPSGTIFYLAVPVADYGVANGTFTSCGISGYEIDNENAFYLDQ